MRKGKAKISYTFEVKIAGRHSLKSCIGPECQRCCCFLYASYDSGNSQSTLTSFRKMNFHPFKWARTAMSMSSTVVRSSQPPESSNALILHTPAVPLNPKKLRNMPFTCCSTSKWKHKLMFWSRVSKFSSLLTNDQRAWTRPSSGFP